MEYDFDPGCLDYYGGNYFATKEEAEIALKQAVSKLTEEERDKPPFIKEISEGSTYYAENKWQIQRDLTRRQWLKEQDGDSIIPIINNNAAGFAERVDSEKFNKSLLTNVGGLIYDNVPLWYITKCWDIIIYQFPDVLFNEHEHIMYCQKPADFTFEKIINNHKQIKEVWKTRFSIDIENEVVDFDRFNVRKNISLDDAMSVIRENINYSDTLQCLFYDSDSTCESDLSDLLEITAILLGASDTRRSQR